MGAQIITRRYDPDRDHIASSALRLEIMVPILTVRA